MPAVVRPRVSLGVDIGGTFTDLVLLDGDSGRQHSAKVLTTADNPARAVIKGTRALLRETQIAPERIGRVVHATTLFTNALIERRGAPTALITTAGFRDVLEIGRERKYELYDLGIEMPAPLVPRNWRLEVVERIGADGRVETPLDQPSLDRAIDAVLAGGITSVAIAFLHSYANDRHEAAAAARIRARAPDVHLSLSHEIAPEIREYDRFSTVAANAYVKPLAERYLRSLEEKLRSLGIRAPLQLMLSSGGLTDVEEGCRAPVQLLESGPAAGALVAGYYGRQEGEDRLLAFDMGGTTAKLALVDCGAPMIAYAFEAARQKRFMEGSGLPIRISAVELIEIGAGGGSIARCDAMGLLKVGPESAGADPGPACYNRGGTQPTVTDANLARGVLNPTTFAGGSVGIEAALAERAIAALAGDAGLTAERVTAGILDIVDENMTAAARVHIAERGRDPRDHSILCTGGGGPAHAYGLARKLGISRVLCPPSAGVASALGLLMAPARVDRVATVGYRVDDGDPARLDDAIARLEGEARERLARMGLDTTVARRRCFADARLIGQGFDLVIPLPDPPFAGETKDRAADRLRDAFVKAYAEKFGRRPPAVGIELLSLRLSLEVAMADDHRASIAGGAAGPALKGHRRVAVERDQPPVQCAVYERANLAPGMRLEGPALVEEAGSTLVIGPRAEAVVRPGGVIVMTLSREGAP